MGSQAPHGLVVTQIYARVFDHLWRASGRNARQVARGAGCSEQYVYVIPKGQRLPSLELSRNLDQAIGADGCLFEVRRLLDVLQRYLSGSMTAGASGIPTLEGEASSSGEESDVERRALLEIVAALSAGMALPPGTLDTVLAGLERALGGDEADLSLEHWEEMAWEYEHGLIGSRPAGSLIGDLAGDIVALSAVLERDHPPLVRNGLERVSAQLAAYMAKELSDTGKLREARRSWQTAIGAADKSRDSTLALGVRAWCAARARWEGRPPRTVNRLLDQVFKSATPSAGLAQALRTRAETLAIAGDGAGATSALDSLRNVYARLPEEVTSRTAPWGWSESDVLFGEAYVYTVLGQTRLASAAIDEALTLEPLENAGRRANLALMQAICAIRDGGISDGLEYAMAAARDVSSTTIRRRITGQIIKALPSGARTLPAAKDLRALTSGSGTPAA